MREGAAGLQGEFWTGAESFDVCRIQPLELSVAEISRLCNLAFMDATSATLLSQLKQPHAEAAWERFCRTYGGAIIRYAMKLGLPEADARDVMQDTLMDLMRQLPKFEYDPQRGKFRNFLLTIVHRRAAKWLAARSKVQLASLDETGATRLLHEISARAIPVADDDTRWQESLFDEAWLRLKRSDKLKSGTIEVFEAYAIRGENPEDVGKKNGMAANTVYQIKNRVLAMLKDEVNKLIAEMDPADLEQLQAGEA